MHPLKAYRKAQTPPLTQDDLAKNLGVKRVTILRWEKGKRKIDSDKVPEISEKTGIAPRDLRPDLATLIGVDT